MRGVLALARWFFRNHLRLEGPRAPVMLVLTAIYLLFELGFNARLLDVVGTRATLDEIHAIEWWGRVITGIAIALVLMGSKWLFWPSWKNPLLFSRSTRPIVSVALSLAIGFATSWGIQETVQNLAVSSASPADRRAALWLRTLQSGIHDGAIEMAGVDLSSAVLSTPEGKATIALLPFMGWQVDGLETRLRGALETAVLRDVTERIGADARGFNGVWISSMAAVLDMFDGPYRQAHRLLEPDEVTLTRVQEGENALVLRQIRAMGGFYHGWNPAQRRALARWIRDERGYPVRDDFVANAPDSPAVFRIAIREKLRRDGQLAFERAMHAMLGGEPLPEGGRPPANTRLPSGLADRAFLDHPAVQRAWRGKLGLPGDGPQLRRDMDLAGWQRLNAPRVDDAVREGVDILMGRAEDYAEGAVHGEAGLAATQALVIPPIAMFFSLLGAMVHVFKTLKWAAETWATPWMSPRLGGAVMAGLLVLCVGTAASPAIATFGDNPISESSMFQAVTARIAGTGTGGTVISHGIRWTIRAQPFAYPVNEAIRQRVLRGMSFGFGGAR